MGSGSILDAILDFGQCWNKSNIYTFQIYIFIIWLDAYNFCTILKQCITSLKTWNFHYRTERNIQPINMVYYIPRPSAIFNDILTQNSPIYGSLHTRVHHKYSRNQYCVVHAILLLRNHFYIVNSYFAAILAAILKKTGCLLFCRFWNGSTASIKHKFDAKITILAILWHKTRQNSWFGYTLAAILDFCQTGSCTTCTPCENQTCSCVDWYPQVSWNPHKVQFCYGWHPRYKKYND